MTFNDDPRIAEALAQLEAAEVGLDEAIVSAKEVEQAVPVTTLSKEDLRLLEEHARGDDAPRSLRELQERIDRGELSWSDLADGRHFDDPDVQSALAPGVKGMRQAYTAIEEGQPVDDIIEAGPPLPPRASSPTEPSDDETYDFLRDKPDD
ncbi:hypothetical protein JOD54_004502 [Actinokineospora baliensis]|uniref:hypothetical protein n=1 Tax=Actinokineospora baliensis TaxID=547056 RepID=UPI00195E3FB6|nr:hypothetical protein [Actinokineospora baliensis]MBM7774298.1 hypothetical protein [Actinokineospora baliensis]